MPEIDDVLKVQISDELSTLGGQYELHRLFPALRGRQQSAESSERNSSMRASLAPAINDNEKPDIHTSVPKRWFFDRDINVNIALMLGTKMTVPPFQNIVISEKQLLKKYNQEKPSRLVSNIVEFIHGVNWENVLKAVVIEEAIKQHQPFNAADILSLWGYKEGNRKHEGDLTGLCIANTEQLQALTNTLFSPENQRISLDEKIRILQSLDLRLVTPAAKFKLPDDILNLVTKKEGAAVTETYHEKYLFTGYLFKTLINEAQKTYKKLSDIKVGDDRGNDNLANHLRTNSTLPETKFETLLTTDPKNKFFRGVCVAGDVTLTGDLSGCDFSRMRFLGKVTFDSCTNLSKANFDGTKFNGNVEFIGCDTVEWLPRGALYSRTSKIIWDRPVRFAQELTTTVSLQKNLGSDDPRIEITRDTKSGKFTVSPAGSANATTPQDAQSLVETIMQKYQDKIKDAPFNPLRSLRRMFSDFDSLTPEEKLFELLAQAQKEPNSLRGKAVFDVFRDSSLVLTSVQSSALPAEQQTPPASIVSDTAAGQSADASTSSNPPERATTVGTADAPALAPQLQGSDDALRDPGLLRRYAVGRDENAEQQRYQDAQYIRWDRELQGFLNKWNNPQLNTVFRKDYQLLTRLSADIKAFKNNQACWNKSPSQKKSDVERVLSEINEAIISRLKQLEQKYSNSEEDLHQQKKNPVQHVKSLKEISDELKNLVSSSDWQTLPKEIRDRAQTLKQEVDLEPYKNAVYNQCEELIGTHGVPAAEIFFDQYRESFSEGSFEAFCNSRRPHMEQPVAAGRGSSNPNFFREQQEERVDVVTQSQKGNSPRRE